MDALILSCSTGGGHNAAGAAIKEELEVRGHHVVMMDPYELVSHKLAEEVGNIYVKMVQHSPKLFGVVYSLGGIVRNIPGKSPVYYANIKVAKKLWQYLQKHPVDVILMPHLYPAELVTYLKKKGVLLPPTVFIATDYVCIPFTEETNCDYYVVPGKTQMADFIKDRVLGEWTEDCECIVKATTYCYDKKYKLEKEPIVRYYVCSINPEDEGIAETVYRAVRHHWHIENSLHWRLPTVFGLDIDPLDEMLRKHRMIYRTHIDMDCTIFNSNSRQMLFATGFYGVRLKSLHFLTTTHHGNTCVMNHTNQIAAMTADIKFYVHSYSPLHDLFLLQNLGLFIRELIFSYAAQRALKILGKVFPFCAGCNSIVRITDSFIINPTENRYQ